MKRLLVLVVAAVAIWSGIWFWQAQALRKATGAWFEARRAEGWEASYDALALRGFPNRLDLTVEGLVLADPETRVVWEAPFVQVLRLVYQPGHVILAFPDTQSVSIEGRAHAVSSERLRASVVTEGDAILRANLEAAVLNVAGPERALAMAGLTAAFHRHETVPRDYRIGIVAEAMALGEGGVLPRPVSADGLDLRAEIVFDRDWTVQAIAGPRPQPERIAIPLAEYRLEGLELNLTGDLELDAQGRADGTLAVRAVNWREALGRAREAGALPDWLSDAVEDGLGILAQLSGRADTLDLTLTLRDGQMSAGLIPLGPAPRLRLP